MSKKEQQKIRSSAIELDSIGEYIPLRDDPKTSYGFLQDDNVPEVDLAAPETVFENRHAKFRKSGIERSFHAGRYLQEASPNEPVKFVTDGDLPNDKADVQLLVDLAGYLTMYGAPIYRVESRIMQVASLLGLEATGFYLPSNIMLSIGDGSKQSPSRTYFLNVPPSNNMSKLERVDRLARNLVKTVSKQYNISDKSKEAIAARRKFIEDENLSCPKLIEKLQSYASTPGLYPFPVILLSGAVNCFALSIIFFGANWDESIFSLVLGALTSFLGWIMDNRYSFKHASIVIAFANSFAIRIFQAITGTTSVCHSTVIIVSLFQYLPGFLFAISMFEFGASLPVAGSVRLLLGFIRSCQVGFGAALGSKSAVELLTFINLWQESYNDLGCSDHIENEWWRVFFFVPMMFGMLVSFNSHYSQWIPMISSGACCFLVSTVSSRFVSSEISSIFAALALGVVANTFARRNDITAIPSIFAGILWLVPGTVGVKGALDAFSGGGANFAMVIIARTISITIGMYIANVLVFPMNPMQKIEAENESMAV